MAITRNVILRELKYYMDAHPHEAHFFHDLDRGLKSHSHGRSNHFCGHCPVVRTTAIVVNEKSKVLHFLLPGTQVWALREDSLVRAAYSMTESAQVSVLNTLRIAEAFRLKRQVRLPLTIDRRPVAANVRRGTPAHSVWSFHYLFRAHSSTFPLDRAVFEDVAWLPITHIGDETLRRRISAATD